MKIVLDSSGWIEFFTGGPLAERYAAYFAPQYDDVMTPTIVLSEVYKTIKRQRGEETAIIFWTAPCDLCGPTHRIHCVPGRGYQSSARVSDG